MGGNRHPEQHKPTVPNTSTGERELYDLTADPAQLDNLAGEEPYASVEQDMAARLAGLRSSPPQTTIHIGPDGAEADRLVDVAYFSQSRFATYRCRLDRDAVVGDWFPCPGSAARLGPLDDGSYDFLVEATDETGAVDDTPAVVSFSVTATGPPVELTTTPPADSAQRDGEVTFSTSASGVVLECRLAVAGAGGDGPRDLCDSGVFTYTGLADGLYRAHVRARDLTSGCVDRAAGDGTVPGERRGARGAVGRRPEPLHSQADREHPVPPLGVDRGSDLVVRSTLATPPTVRRARTTRAGSARASTPWR